MEVTVNKNNYDISVQDEYNQIKISTLRNKLDVAEKYHRPKFKDFSDVEIIRWFLYESKHLNKNHDRTERTIKEYERELFSFIKNLLSYGDQIGLDIDHIIEGSLFKSLQSRHLRKYQEWLSEQSPYALKKGYSPATLSRKTTILKSFFSFLHEQQYIYEPIHTGFKIASVRNEDRPNRDLGPADVIRILDTFKECGHTIMFSIVHVLVTTGIRNEEFCKLKVKDVKTDFISGGMYLDVTGKGNKNRHIPLKDKVVSSIDSFRAARGLLPIAEANKDDPLFTTNRGLAYSPSYLSQYVEKQITNMHMELSIKDYAITPHYFRHAFAIISKINGVDVYDIMRSLGHEKIETTMIYLDKIFEKERHAIHSWNSNSFGNYI